MKSKNILGILLFSILLTACKGLEPLPSTDKPPLPTASNCILPPSWTINFTQSGGLLGISNNLTVDSDGNYHVGNLDEKDRATGKLGEQDILIIRDLIEESCPFARQPQSKCADCFLYTLELTTSNQVYQFEANEIEVQGTSIAELISKLEDILTRVTKGKQ